MDKNLHNLYYSSLLSESPSIRDSTSRHANRFINSFEMSSMHLLPSNIYNQSVYLNPNQTNNTLMNETLNETIGSNRGYESMALINFEETELDDNELDDSISDNTINLYYQFFETIEKFGSNDDNIFDILKEFELLCNDHLMVTSNLIKTKVRNSSETQSMSKLENLLHLERNSWRLFKSIFEDRNSWAGVDNQEDMIIDDMITKMSDKKLVDRLFEKNCLLKQMQIVVDWLERNQLDDNEDVANDKVQFYSEGPYSWENTLHVLKTKAENYAKERQLCEKMDPDGPIRTKRGLHDLDVEDENRLFRYIFQLLRSGQLDGAKDIAQQLGYHWLAAALEGWLLYHDPNYDNDLSSHKVLEPIEGNPNRDVWKCVCWKASKMEGTNIYERAIFAALSGNIGVVLPLCSRWTDKLWAYFKCSLDVHIENELRTTSVVRPEAKPRFRVDLPDTYWDNKLSAKEIFREIESRGTISSVAEESYHQNIQKFVILGEIESLIDYIYECSKNIIQMTETKIENRVVVKSEQKAQVVEPQLLRFFAHIVLALRSLKVRTSRESLCDAILESYITYLIDRNQIKLVAFYTSQLPKSNQITTFAKLLERIEDENDRKLCIVLAQKANLDITSITSTVVNSIRTKPEEQSLELSNDLLNVTTSEDKKKINALDWLLFDEVQQWSEAMKQSNSLMRSFLLMRKVDAMKDTFNKLPEDIIDRLFKHIRLTTGSSELNADDDNTVREYLCHKAYIQANDAFTDWLYCLHNSKPKEPSKPTSTRFMDTVAYEHSLKQFESELTHWKEMLKNQGRLAAEKIINVLLFPDGGWMADQRDDCTPDDIRVHQMEELKRQYIPQLVFIAHSIHKSSNNLFECMKLADIVADEHKAIYKTFSPQLLIDLLKKFRETSIEILNKTSDPLGYPTV